MKLSSRFFRALLFLTTIAADLSAALPQGGVAAHRGASGTHPENTVSALQEAVRLGGGHAGVRRAALAGWGAGAHA